MDVHRFAKITHDPFGAQTAGLVFIGIASFTMQ